MSAQSLKKMCRILKREDFLRVGRIGKRLKTRHFIILYTKNDLGYSRVGITASKKTGNAVKRNRVKRVLREFFRLNRDSLYSSTDYIFIAGRGSYLLGYHEAGNELLGAFEKLEKIKASRKSAGR